MPEIGPTLREARMRAHIDITEVEQATKIRAKYLRAIENEEWQLLPGSTFVKSFIREYAAYLGLDARGLVEEYKVRYERPSEHELRSVGAGFSRGGGRSGSGGGGGGRGAPRWAITAGLVVILLAALYFVGSLGGDDGDGGGGNAAETTATTPSGAAARRAARARRQAAQRRRREAQRRRQQAAARTEAGLRIVPTGEVYVCLVDGDGNVLIPGTIYAAGQSVPVQRAAELRLLLGNSNVELRANGRPVEVAPSPDPAGFAITPSGATPISGDDLPACE